MDDIKLSNQIIDKCAGPKAYEKSANAMVTALAGQGTAAGDISVWGTFFAYFGSQRDSAIDDKYEKLKARDFNMAKAKQSRPQP